MAKPLIVALIIFQFTFTYGQKYNFVNWTVEDGLIQSQASAICQDNYGQLWIGTEGGISRFDGKKFTGYTVQEGLISNRIISLCCDSLGKLWIGTNSGICRFDGSRFQSPKSASAVSGNIYSIAQLKGFTYALNNSTLYKIAGLESERVIVSGDSSEKVSALYSYGNTHLMAAVLGKGIYYYSNSVWQRMPLRFEDLSELYIRKILITTQRDTLILANRGLLQIKNRKAEAYRLAGEKLPNSTILCLAEDQKQNLWLGSAKGVYKIEKQQLIHFNEKKGFTDNSVHSIFKDVENNLWFGTNGDGIYKFRENTFTYYDKSSGLSSAIVMGIVQCSDGQIYAGGYGGGIFKIDPQGTIKPFQQPGYSFNESKINCLYADKQNNLYVGTLYEGAFKYNPKSGIELLTEKNRVGGTVGGVICFLKDHKGNLLIGGQQGLFLKVGKDSLRKIQLGSGLVTALRQLDENTVLVGTSKGLFELDANYNARLFGKNRFDHISVLCLATQGDNIWIGTSDNGIMSFNKSTGAIIKYNTSGNLPSNFIYSIDVTEKNRVWIGTGFGISNLWLDANGKILGIKNYGRTDGLLGMECNHNSILRAADSSLWFGTTRGLFHFNPKADLTEKNRPRILLRSVKLFSGPISDSTLFDSWEPWFRVPTGLSLESKQNHLTFELGSIYFTKPEDVIYRYKLEGVDKDFTTTSNALITYPSLPPGKYTLKAKGVTRSGVFSVNEIDYPFIIKKAFYQTRLFQGMMIVLLLCLGALLAFLASRGRQKRKQREKEITEKIREQEFTKLKQRTAEDFHDEMGNNLTRISVLTDVLKSKLSEQGPEVKQLVQQIKESTASLYSGSKDIIWSLHAQNDGMYEIAEHAKDLGRELFQDTSIDFTFEHTIPIRGVLKLKLDYSRNLTMIFKEAYNNIIKHSECSEVKVTLKLQGSQHLDISISDNGKGFEEMSTGMGNGITNMKNRAGRMEGDLEITSVPGKGTEISIRLKNIFINENGKN